MSNRTVLLFSFLFWAAQLTFAVVTLTSTVDPDGATYLGCFYDSGDDRLLSGPATGTQSMTIEYCHSYCSSQGYNIFGVEDGSQCFCGNETTGSTPSPSDGCDYLCDGDLTEICGGFDPISLYNFASTTDTLGAAYLGCFHDDGGDRLLVGHLLSSDNMTIEICHTYCQGQNYDMFGVEDATQCFCGNETTRAPSSDNPCAYTCSGDSTETCGGYDAISLYDLTPSSNIDPLGGAYLGCYIDVNSARILDGYTQYDYSDDFTIQSCHTTCQNQGYSYFGVEFYYQCL